MFGYKTRTVLLLCAVTAIQALQAPVITFNPQTAAVGATVRLECVAQGDPSPTVKLYRNNVLIQGQEAATFPPIAPNYGGAKYIFTAVQESGGPYECRANNGVRDANGNTVIKKVVDVIITGLSTTGAPQTTPPTTTPQTPPSTTPPTTTPQTPPPTAPQTLPPTVPPTTVPQTPPPTTDPHTDQTTVKFTGPTNPVITDKITYKPTDDNNPISGSSIASSLSLSVLLLVAISILLCQRF